MNELIFAYFGGISLIIFLSCIFLWILKEINRKYKGKYYDNLKDKLDKYDGLAKNVVKQANILEKDDWNEYEYSSYDFKKLTKELLELRKLKEKMKWEVLY